jgi:hypothetical protein
MMRAMIVGAVLGLAGLGLGGCVKSNYMAVGSQSFPPRPDDYIIDVYLPVDAPVAVHKGFAGAKDIGALPRGAMLIGRVDTDGSPDASWQMVLRDAKRKARVLGGDALVLRGTDQHVTGITTYGNAYSYGKSVSLEVVRFTR